MSSFKHNEMFKKKTTFFEVFFWYLINLKLFYEVIYPNSPKPAAPRDTTVH